MHRLLAALALTLVAASQAATTPGTHTFRGYAYDLDSGKFLYTEVHRQVIDGDRWVGGTIDYYAADGSRIGHKVLDFSSDPYVPVYRLELAPGGGYVEGITGLTADRIEMEKKGYGASEMRTAAVKRTVWPASRSAKRSRRKLWKPESATTGSWRLIVSLRTWVSP